MELVKFSKLSDELLDQIVQIHYNHWSQFTDFMVYENVENKFKNIFTDDSALPIGYALMDGNKLYGFCTLKKDNLESCKGLTPWISSVMILEEERGKGYGRLLLNLISEEAYEMGYNTVYLWTDKAPEFYEKIGFHYEGEVDKNNNEGTGLLFSKKKLTF